MGFHVDDRAFTEAVSSLMGRWRKNTRVGMRRYGDLVAERMRRRIHSDSGELVSRVGVVDHTDEEPPYIEVGAFEADSLDPHGIFDEFGTIHMAPRPFARPAFLESDRDFTVEP